MKSVYIRTKRVYRVTMYSQYNLKVQYSISMDSITNHTGDESRFINNDSAYVHKKAIVQTSDQTFILI